ncbi:sulfotransferase family 2 domain-containing protein [Solidesulfovibrio sp.]
MLFLKAARQQTRLLFVHMPKAGGSSLLELIRFRIFHDRTPRWCYIGNPDEAQQFKAASQQDLMAMDFVGGHVSLETFVEKMQENFSQFFSFTILRDPLTRAVSLYHYICNTPIHFQYEEVKRLSLMNYIASPLYPRNHQCHLLKQSSTAAEAIPFAEQHLHAVGLFEDLPGVVSGLEKIVEFPLGAMPHTNKAPRTSMACSRQVLCDLIRTADAEDMRLYDHFRSRRATRPPTIRPPGDDSPLLEGGEQRNRKPGGEI